MDVLKESVEVRGHRLSCKRAGEGEEMLYLHSEHDVGTWSPFLDELAGKYYVIAPEHPGFGHSERPDWIETVDDMVFYYMDLLEQLRLERVHLVGSSIGGWIAAELAIRHPERLRSLVLIGAYGLRVKGEPYADIFALSQEKLMSMYYHTAEAVPRWNEEELQMRLHDRRMLAQLAWRPRLYDPKLHERLARLKVPTLILWGEEDRIAPQTLAKTYGESIPGARVEMIPECGHLPMLEQPRKCTGAVLDFLDGLKEEDGT